MDTPEIKLKCLELATRDSGINGFVPSRIVDVGKQFYEWVTEEDKLEEAPRRLPGRPKKSR